MSATHTTGKPSAVSKALARDRLGIPAVLFFVLAGVAPLTVAAGVIPATYATTGLTAIPAAFVAVAVILGLFATGYVAMARRVPNAGPFYALIARSLGRVPGVAAALAALLAYSLLQVGLYGALGPNAAAEAAAHLHIHAAWWVWAFAAWAIITILGLLRVDITGRILGVLLTAEVAVIAAETVSGLAHPAGGHLSFATLSPDALTSAGWGSFGVLAVVAVLGFVGFEQAPVLAEEARHPHRTIPAATYAALGVIAVVYAGVAWAMAAHTGTSHLAATAAQQGPGLLFGLGSGALSQAAQLLFLTSLFAAALAFHNTTWRYMFSLAREGVLPAGLARTGASNIPRAASLAQSATGLAAISVFALAGWPPFGVMFFWLGTTGGFGILVLLTVTSVAVLVFFTRDPHRESTFTRLTAPFLAASALGVVVVLAVWHYNLLLGVTPGSAASWALPGAYAAVAAIGVGWGRHLKARHPATYARIGLGAHAATSQAARVASQEQW